MTNEQRAHDLTMALIQAAFTDHAFANNEMSVIDFYKKHYDDALEKFNKIYK